MRTADLKQGLMSIKELRFFESTYATAYFVYKFILYILGFIGFSLIHNLMLFALFFISFKKVSLNYCYKFALIVLSLVILYYDSFLPDFNNLRAQLDDKSLSYVIDLGLDILNINYVLGFIAVYVACFLLTDYVHGYTVITVLFAFITFEFVSPYFVERTTDDLNLPTGKFASGDIPPQLGESTPQNIEEYLKAFLEKEKSRVISFPEYLPDNFEPFDILIVNICSLAKDDLVAVKQDNNPLFKEFDVSFENFNSVSSYSTAATLRLLRANCGQETEITMYQGARGECNLLDSLQRLGYRSQVFLDHNGVFGDYLKTLRELAAIPEPIYPLNRLKVQYNAFDGAPIYSDHDVFAAYMEESSKNNGMYLGFMNLISLHDGNRLPGKEKSETYPPRLKLMLENLTYLVEELKKSSRRTMLVVIPEHGAAIRGDKMQIARLREIPTTKITNVPLLVKFFNLPQDEILDEPIKIHGFHSYLALSELIKRAIENNIFSANDSLSSISEICASLPQQAAVSESTNAYFMVYKDTDFYKLKGDEWNEYKN